jgi:cell division protein FtsI (penicillin-binding protein 3)
MRGKPRTGDSLPARLAARSLAKANRAESQKALFSMKKPKNSVKRQQLNPGLKKPVRVHAIDWGRVRLQAVVVIIALLWLGLWTRAAFVQLVNGPSLEAMAARQHRTSEFVVGERGQIFDSKGRLLAKSVAVKSVFVDPRKVVDKQATAETLAPILKMSVQDILAQLKAKGAHAWIARQVGDAVGARVEEAGLAGVYITTEYARQYPNKELAGRLLGFVGLDDQGLEGLESAFNDHLAGKRAEYAVERDATGSKLYFDALGREVEVRGKDLTLTVDSTIQYMAEEVLAGVVEKNKGKWGGCLVVRVDDGHILAWAEYPAFNPNAYRTYAPEQWLNRMVMEPIEPGSAIKPLLVAAAMQEKKVEPDTIFYCEKGRMRLEKKTIRDVSSREWLSVSHIVQFSSNIGVAKIAMEVGAAKYHAYLSRLGFGSRMGLPLAGERSGILRAPETWDTFELATAGFGQGFSATLPQLARAYLCLANDGVLKPLHLVRDPAAAPQPATRVFDPTVARKVMRMLALAVEDGTGGRARIPGLSIGGKTSTAQKASPEGGYGDKIVASFVGFVPAEKPEYLILVSVDEPESERYGGVVAAPAFRDVALKTMAYLGRLPEAAPVVAEAAAVAPEPSRSNNEIRGKVDRSNLIGSGKVPDVRGYTVRKAVEVFAGRGIVPSLKGSGHVVGRQSPEPGAPWPDPAKQFILWLQSDAEQS